MKKYILSALVACLYLLCALFPLARSPVHADDTPAAGGYACVLENDVFFYASKDEKQGLFLLPKSYFVKVLEAAPDYTKIEYLYDGENTKKLTGYAKTSQLTFVDYTPASPYLTLSFEVKYRLDDDELQDPSFLNELTVTCAYYGDYKIGSKTYCYILRGDAFGYILKPDDLTYEENPEYAERLRETASENTSDPPAEEEEQSGASPAQIAILIALCLLVPVLAALILKTPKKPPYEEE